MTVLFLGAVISVALAHPTPLHPALISRAAAVGSMSVFGAAALAIALWLIVRSFREHWPAEAKVAALALPTVMVQGVLGGVTVLFFLPWYVSTLHATVGQTFFSLVILMALVTSAGWKSTSSERAKIAAPDATTRALAFASVACAYIQLMLGAAFRHSGMKLLPHLIWACVTTIVLAWTGIRILRRHHSSPPLRRAAHALVGMLALQLLLGFAAYLTRVVWSADAVQPLTSMVASTVAHVAGGAILLALTWITAAEVVCAGERATPHLYIEQDYRRQAVTA
jgi:heme A synthase